MNDHEPPETTATILALTARRDQPDEPGFSVQLAGASIGEMLAASLRSAGIPVALVLTRPGWEESIRRTFGDDVPIVTATCADDALSSLVTAPRASQLLVPAHAVAPAFLLRSVVSYPAATPAVVLLDADADAPGVGVSVVDGRIERFGNDDAMSGIVWLPDGASSAESDVDANASKLIDVVGTDLVVGADVVARALTAGGGVRAVSPRHATVDLATDSVAAGDLVRRRADRPSDEEARTRDAVKEWDSWFTTFFVSSYTKYVARFLGRRHVAPNAVTLASLVVALLAAALVFVDRTVPTIAAAVLLQLSFSLDCVDGQLARYSARFSRLGAYFDVASDRIKEYAVMLAMAWTVDTTSAWVALTTALALHTSRHLTNVTYARLGAEPIDATAPGSPSSATARRDRDRAAGGAGHWLRRVATFSIGERLALLSLGLVFGRFEIALWTYAGWVVLALVVQFAGRWRRPDRRVPLGTAALDLDAPFGGDRSPWRGADALLLVITAAAAVVVDSTGADVAALALWLGSALVLAPRIRPSSAAIVSLVDFVPLMVLLAGDRESWPLGCLAAVLAVVWADRTYVDTFSVTMPWPVNVLRLGVVPRQAVVLGAASIGLAGAAAVGLSWLLGCSLVWGWIVVARVLTGPRGDQTPAVSLP